MRMEITIIIMAVLIVLSFRRTIITLLADNDVIDL